MQRPSSRAFTLIELMVVIVILGMLASVVMAMVTVSHYDARRVSAEAAAQTVQQAIGYYRECTGRLPDLTGPNWAPLTQQTEVNGKLVGPFLQAVPKNLQADGDPSCVTDTAGELYTTTCAFAYDYRGGQGTGRFVPARRPGAQ